VLSTGSTAPRKAELGRACPDSHLSWRPPAMGVLSAVMGRWPPRRMKMGRPPEDVGVQWCCEPLISGTRESRGIPDCCCEHGPQTLRGRGHAG
jgi:hypothetical protein